MKAVNLIPADQLRANGAAGKSGGGVYVLLGGLALIVACVAALTLTNRSVADNVARADRLESQAKVAQAKAGGLASYKTFNAAVKTRSTGVQALAATRFDWGETLEQVSRVIPADVSLMQLAASMAPGTTGGIVTLRSSLENPAVEIIGCAPSQSRVALLIARLRRLEGVQRVSVQSSGKADDASSGGAAGTSDSAGGGGGGGGSCQTTDEIPKFQIVVFFGAAQAVAGTSSASGIQGAIATLNGGTSGTTPTPAPATPGS
jgi:Tfp pilus assembly protein PilN